MVYVDIKDISFMDISTHFNCGVVELHGTVSKGSERAAEQGGVGDFVVLFVVPYSNKSSLKLLNKHGGTL